MTPTGRLSLLPAMARCLWAITQREALRFFGQKSRFFSSLVRPLIWLIVFAAGFRAALGLSIQPPYQTYISYDIYIVPGLIGMIQLFNGMQSSLSLVYDREMGSMRLLMTSPMPRWWLLFSKLTAGTLISILQIYAFLAIAALLDIRFPIAGYFLVFPFALVSGLMLGSLGLLLSSRISQLENFAGVMNFVIFPMFFLSTALYPLWKMAEASTLLRDLCAFNPFSHAIESIRFALYGQVEWAAFGWTALAFGIFFAASLWSYDPARSVMARKNT